jgi:hypothetical protein
MDEGADIAELQLDGGAHVIEAYDLRELMDDSEAAFDTTQVIVR